MTDFLHRLMAHSVMGPFVLILLATIVATLGTAEILIFATATPFATTLMVARLISYGGTTAAFGWAGWNIFLDLRR